MFDPATYRQPDTTKSLGVRAKAMRPTDVAARRGDPFQYLREQRELELMLFMANIDVSPELKCAFLSYTVEYVSGVEEITPKGIISVTEGGWKPLAANLSTVAATEIQRWNIRAQMLDIVGTLSEYTFIVGSIDSDSIVCKPIDGPMDSLHHVRIASFDPLFVVSTAMRTDEDEGYEASDDCLYFVNLLLFLHSALTYPVELRIALMKEIALNAVAKWAQMEANATLSPFCSYLKIDPSGTVPAYVPTYPLPVDKFLLVDYVVSRDQRKTSMREAFQYCIRGFNSVIPGGGGIGYMAKILNYLKGSYVLEEDAVRDRMSILNAQGNGWRERRPRRRVRRPSSGDDDLQPPPKRQ
jgi:hypothetical protein